LYISLRMLNAELSSELLVYAAQTSNTSTRHNEPLKYRNMVIFVILDTLKYFVFSLYKYTPQYICY
jgi:hypothetical protein